MLDFTEMDMTAPNKVVEEILQQLSENTNNIIHGRIEEYTGYIASYTIANPALKLGEALASFGTENHEVEELLYKILTSKKILGVMQELIRIHQAGAVEEAAVATDDSYGT